MRVKIAELLRNISALTILFGVVLLCCIWAGLYYIVQNERQLEIKSAVKENANYARLFEEHTVRTINGLDQIVLDLKNRAEKDGLDIDLRRLVGEGRFSGQPFVAMGVLNKNGDLVASSQEITARINNSDLEFFQVHRTADTGKLYIGKPLLGRASGKWLIQMSRRINLPDGSFGGAIVVGVDPYYFAQVYKQLNLGENSSIALIGRDGTLRVQQSGNEVSIGLDFGQRVRNELSGSGAGIYTDESIVDGIRRFFSYRTLSEYPLIVTVGESEATVFADLNRRIAGYLWAGGIVSILIVLFVVLLLKGIAQRKRDEIALHRNAEIQVVLKKIAEAAVVMPTLDELYCEVHRLLLEVIPTENFHLALLDEENNQIVDGYSVDITNQILKRRPIGRGLTEYALRQGRPVHVTQVEIQGLLESGELTRQPISPTYEWLGAPLLNSAGKCFGVMAVVSRDPSKSFRPGDIEVLSIIAAQVAMSIERKQMENKLRDSETRFRKLSENARVMIYRMSLPDGKYEYVSPASLQLTGFTPEEIYSGSAHIVNSIHPEFREYFQKAWENLLHGEMPAFYEYKTVHRDGTERWLHQSNVLVCDENGAPIVSPIS